MPERQFHEQLVNNKLSYEELQQRRQQLRQDKEKAKNIGSALALDPSGVASVAYADEVGDYFQYVIDHKVTLPRQKSALLPIVNEPVEGTRVSIFNESVQAKFPLLGLRFKNTTGQNLMQGPITVYEGGTYAGDARVMDLQPNEERLLSYAIDQGVEVKAESAMRAGAADLRQGGQGHHAGDAQAARDASSTSSRTARRRIATSSSSIRSATTGSW